jgi:hypothetical protein
VQERNLHISQFSITEGEKMTYREALLRARLTKKETAKFFNVSIQTVERWYRINKTPTGVIPALKLLSGDCPVLSVKDGWQNWAFFDGFLWSPELDKFTPGDIRASKMDRDIIRGYERETAKLIKDLKARHLLDDAIVQVKKSNVIPFPTVNRIALRAVEKRDSDLA